MSGGEARRIGVLDWRGDRLAVLLALLEPSAAVSELLAPEEASDPALGLILVDPPRAGADPDRLAALAAAAGGRPILVLGPLPEGAPPGIHALDGALLPARLTRTVERLLRPGRTRAPSWSDLLAAFLPLSDEQRERLLGLARSGLPILLAGEPGTGRALLARTLLTPAGTPFQRLGAGWALPAAPPALSPPTVYAADLAAASTAELAAVPGLVAAALDGRIRLVFAAHDAERALEAVDDPLRLLLAPAAVTLAPLRADPGAIPGRLRRLVRAVAERFGTPPPELGPELDSLLAGWPWPLNYAELLAAARRAVTAAPGRPLAAGDLGLGPARAARRSEEPAAARAADARPGALDGLVQELAHEIKNPLVSVKTFTQLLPERFEDAEFRDQYFRLVSADVDRIDAVLAELDEYARLRDPRREPVDLTAAVNRALETHQFVLRKRAIEVRSRLPERAPAVDTDPELVGWALDAVLREAVAAMPEGTRLDISPGSPRSGRGRGRAVVFRYRIAPDSPAAARLDREHMRREVIGLTHALAARVLKLLGGALLVEDTLDGDARVTVSIDD